MGIDPTEVLEFWFGDGADPLAKRAQWFKKDPAFDDAIRARFGDTLETAAKGDLDPWRATRDGRLALVIVLDQFSRNVYRDTPRAFAQDARACETAELALAQADDASPPLTRAQFLFMPFMHAEDLAQQERCIRDFRGLTERAPDDVLRAHFHDCLKFAEAHAALIRRFGRFPHRNAILGRESTPDEIAALADPRSSF